MIKSGWVDRDKVKMIIYLFVIGCSIGICFLGIKSNADQQQQRKVEHAEATIKNEVVKIERLNKQISQLYNNNQSEFLADSIEDSAINKVEEQIITVKSEAGDFGLKSKDFSMDTSEVVQSKKELISKVKDIKSKSAIQNQVTKLLVERPTNWEVKDETIVITHETTAEKILQIREKINGNTSMWNNAITVLLDEMDIQVKQYNELKQSINLMINGEELTNDANFTNFILNYNQLELIKNDILRKELSDKLELIDKLLENHVVSEVPNNLEEEVPPQSE